MSETLASGGYVQEPCTTAAPVIPSIETVNMFQKSEQFVNTMRNKVALITISLTRNGNTREFQATPDSTVFRYTDYRSFVTAREQSRDYIIDIDDYRTLSTPLTPEKGDIIKETIGVFVYEYQVMPFNGEPHYKTTGAYRTAYRVHTKLIKKDTI